VTVTTYEAGVREEQDGSAPQYGAGDASGEATVHRSTAAIAGHPLHPMLVPVPIGLLTAAVVSDGAYAITGDSFWARASRWLLGGGLLAGLMAATLGLVDFSTISRARSTTGVTHAAGNATILGLTGISLLLRRGAPRHVPAAAMALSGIAAALLAVTGWLGGELSYREGIGVIPDDQR
jgi:uncharacterized membrane protein